MCVCVCVCVCVCIYIYIYIYTYVCMYVCMYVLTYSVFEEADAASLVTDFRHFVRAFRPHLRGFLAPCWVSKQPEYARYYQRWLEDSCLRNVGSHSRTAQQEASQFCRPTDRPTGHTLHWHSADNCMCRLYRPHTPLALSR